MMMARMMKDEQIDIHISRMRKGSENKDYTMVDSDKLQVQLTDLITEHAGIFSYSVNGSMDVSTMEFTVHNKVGETEWHRDRSQSQKRLF